MRLLCMQPFPRSGMLACFYVPPWLRILPTLCVLPASLTRFIIRRIIDRTHFLRLSAEAALRFLRMPRTPAPPKHKAQSTNHNAHEGQKQKKQAVLKSTQESLCILLRRCSSRETFWPMPYSSHAVQEKLKRSQVLKSSPILQWQIGVFAAGIPGGKKTLMYKI